MSDCGERVDHSDAAPREAILHVFGEQQAAAGFGRYSDHQAVPNAELMIGGEIGGSNYRRFSSRCERKSVAPCQYRGARLIAGPARFSHKHIVELAERLDRYQTIALCQRLHQYDCRLLMCCSVYALDIGENIRIKCRLH